MRGLNGLFTARSSTYSQPDHYSYTIQSPNGPALFEATVVDIYILTVHFDDIEHLYRTLLAKIEDNDLGQPLTFLRSTGNRLPGSSVHLSQPILFCDTVLRSGLHGASSSENRWHHKPYFDENKKTPYFIFEEKLILQSVLDDLQYFADSSRADITYVASRFARKGCESRQHHFTLLKHALRYFRSTKDHRLLYRANANTPKFSSFHGTFIVQQVDPKSISNFIHTFFGFPVAWPSGKQGIIV